VLNAWDFFDLPASTPEFLHDEAQGPNGAASQLIPSGASFRVVRELDEKPATRASMQP
jgi:hypothetical protein